MASAIYSVSSGSGTVDAHNSESFGRGPMVDQTKSQPPMLSMAEMIGHYSQTIRHDFGELARPDQHPLVRGAIASRKIQATAIALVTVIIGVFAMYLIPVGAGVLLALAAASFLAMVFAGPVQDTAGDSGRVQRSVIRAGHRYLSEY